jgi:uncharacterized protein (TIGR01777 family)
MVVYFGGLHNLSPGRRVAWESIMRIGITGATGFIGSALGRHAAEAGHEIVAFSRSGQVNVPWVTDCRTMSPGADFSGCDALVHLGGESLLGWWTRSKKERIWSSRVDLTRSVVDSMARAPSRPSVFVCASGAGWYGSRDDELLDESSARGKGFLSDLCEKWEAEAMRACDQGVRVVTLRTGMVLGREGGAFPLLRRVFGLGLGGRLGDGRQWTSWIHVRDAAATILWALENPRVRGPLNLVSPGPVTNAEFTRTLARHLRRPAFCRAPAFALRLLLREMAGEMLLASQRAVPRAALDLGCHFSFPALDGALGDLLRR